MTRIDWTTLAGQLGLLHENGEHADRESALRAVELILGEEALAAAVDFYVSLQPGSELVHYVLMLLRPLSAQRRCYEIYRSDTDPDNRRFALDLFRDIADRRAIPWIGELLAEQHSEANVHAMDLLGRLIKAERAMPQDVEEHLLRARDHPNPVVQEIAFALRRFIDSDMGRTLISPLEELLVDPEQPVRLQSRGSMVARLFFEETDDPSIKYRFEPLLRWRKLGSATEVFSESPGRSLESGLKVIEARVRAIEDLDLWLVSEDGSVTVGDFLFSIRDNQLVVRSYPRGLLPQRLQTRSDP